VAPEGVCVEIKDHALLLVFSRRVTCPWGMIRHAGGEVRGHCTNVAVPRCRSGLAIVRHCPYPLRLSQRTALGPGRVVGGITRCGEPGGSHQAHATGGDPQAQPRITWSVMGSPPSSAREASGAT